VGGVSLLRKNTNIKFGKGITRIWWVFFFVFIFGEVKNLEKEFYVVE